MYLGLIDRPFVPHNLISAEGSPVPLPKFQMVPRFKILMSCESKKGTQIYHPFLSKSPGKQIPSRFFIWGHYGERYLLTGHFTSINDMNTLIVSCTKIRKEHPINNTSVLRHTGQ